MLSRRDKLLIRPWQQRRFDNHRKKVQSALPAIDSTPPKSREHVLYKRKKHQTETERSIQIEKENLLLLRKMGYIMKTNRVDNYWSTPPPNFLNRVHLFQCKMIEKEKNEKLSFPDFNETIRKTKCVACTPQDFKIIDIPEERIPWEPPKPSLSIRLRSKSLPPRPISMHNLLENRTAIAQKSNRVDEQLEKKKERSKSTHGRRLTLNNSAHSLVLSRGSLKLYVNFPPDTNVKLQDGTMEKIISRGSCKCKKH